MTEALPGGAFFLGRGERNTYTPLCGVVEISEVLEGVLKVILYDPDVSYTKALSKENDVSITTMLHVFLETKNYNSSPR